MRTPILAHKWRWCRPWPRRYNVATYRDFPGSPEAGGGGVGHSEASSAQELSALRQAQAGDVSGIVLFPVDGSTNALAIAELRKEGIPVVMVDRYLPNVATGVVTADNFAIWYQGDRTAPLRDAVG